MSWEMDHWPPTHNYRLPAVKRVILSFLAAMLAAGAVLAQPTVPARSLTPEEAVALGLAHSRTLDAASQQVIEAEARYREARTMRLPVLAAQGSYLRLSPNVPGFEVALPTAPPGSGPVTIVPPIHNRYNVQLSIQQPLFTGGRIRNSVEVAAAQADVATAERDRTQADLALEIEQAYWTYYEALAVEDVVRNAVAQVEAHLEHVRNYRRTGLATDSDVLAVEARLADVRLRHVEAANGARLARLNLNHLTGLPLGTDVRPVAGVQVEPVAAGVDVLVAQALAERPELAALGRQVDALDAGVRVARAAYLPQVALSGNYRYANPNPYFLPPEDRFAGTWDVGVVLSMDLWNWGRTGAQTQQAQARRRQAEDRLEALRDLVRLDVHRRYLDVQRAQESVAVARQAVAAADEAYRVVQERYAQGLALNTDVLDAEAAQREARLRAEQATADYALARAALRHATGASPLP